MSMKIVLGVDPGFASFGYGAIALDGDGAPSHVEAFGVIETVKEPNKKHVLATEENLRRAREISKGFLEVLDELASGGAHVLAIGAEAMSYVRSATAMAKVGISWGVLATCAASRGIPIVQGSPQAVKKALTGASNASKEEIQAVVKRLVPRAYGELSTAELFAAMGNTRLEHPADALACALYAIPSDIVLAARRAA
jgi:crossover junction endodeoxyribonuclease RuvC